MMERTLKWVIMYVFEVSEEGGGREFHVLISSLIIMTS